MGKDSVDKDKILNVDDEIYINRPAETGSGDDKPPAAQPDEDINLDSLLQEKGLKPSPKKPPNVTEHDLPFDNSPSRKGRRDGTKPDQQQPPKPEKSAPTKPKLAKPAASKPKSQPAPQANQPANSQPKLVTRPGQGNPGQTAGQPILAGQPAKPPIGQPQPPGSQVPPAKPAMPSHQPGLNQPLRPIPNQANQGSQPINPNQPPTLPGQNNPAGQPVSLPQPPANQITQPIPIGPNQAAQPPVSLPPTPNQTGTGFNPLPTDFNFRQDNQPQAFNQMPPRQPHVPHYQPRQPQNPPQHRPQFSPQHADILPQPNKQGQAAYQPRPIQRGSPPTNREPPPDPPETSGDASAPQVGNVSYNNPNQQQFINDPSKQKKANKVRKNGRKRLSGGLFGSQVKQTKDTVRRASGGHEIVSNQKFRFQPLTKTINPDTKYLNPVDTGINSFDKFKSTFNRIVDQVNSNNPNPAGGFDQTTSFSGQGAASQISYNEALYSKVRSKKLIAGLIFLMLLSILAVGLYPSYKKHLAPELNEIISNLNPFDNDREELRHILAKSLNTSSQRYRVTLTSKSLRDSQLNNELADNSQSFTIVNQFDFYTKDQRSVLTGKTEFEPDKEDVFRPVDLETIAVIIQPEQADSEIAETANFFRPGGQADGQYVTIDFDDYSYDRNNLDLVMIDNLIFNHQSMLYFLLIPTVKISDLEKRSEAEDLLEQSGVYDISGCQAAGKGNRSCTVAIDYQKLYKYYKSLNELILKTAVFKDYEILNKESRYYRGDYLPEQVTVEFDNKQLVKMSFTTPNDEKITIEYLEYNSLSDFPETIEAPRNTIPANRFFDNYLSDPS